MPKFRISVPPNSLLRLLSGSLILFTILCRQPCGAAMRADAPADARYLSENFPGPTPPTKPTAPVKPSLTGRQEKAEPPQRPAAEKAAPPKDPRPAPSTAEIKKQPAKQSPADRTVSEPTAQTPAKNEPQTPAAQQKAAQEQDHQRFIQTWIKNTLYFLLLFAACGIIFYLHRHPAPKAKRPRPQTQPQMPSPLPPLSAAPPLGVEFSPNIKNKSLLEQLIKYDMETYGELRSTLNYDQPAYVDLLIRKYGGGDTDKINRAIHLFHMRRRKQ